jgi:alkylation response protein AidB-like acyl-CoA dehydrogenase
MSLFIVPKVPRERGRLAWARATASPAARSREDGHPRQRHLRDELRRRDRLPLGEEHKGMRAMFTMMNEARSASACRARAGRGRLSERAGLRQGPPAGPRRDRREEPRRPGRPADRAPRRAPRADGPESFVEGARAFILWGATDDRPRPPRPGEREAAEGLISLLTPVIKGFLTDKGFDMTVKAQQVYGGHGYIEEWGMSQFARDARIAMIYEGANGVQALDLVGRKLAQDGGKHVMASSAWSATFLKETRATRR